MNFKNIRYFVAIAEERNISSAARKLYVSQQSLSEQLRKLEEEVGAPLVKRQNPLVLTLAGEIMYENGRKMLQDYDELLADIHNITNSRRSKITIGIATYSQPPFLASLIKKYQELYPQYEVSVVKRQHADISHYMNGVDLYISYLPVDPNLEVVPILENDPICASFRKSLVMKYCGDDWQSCLDELSHTRSVLALQKLPFLILEDRHGQPSLDLTSIFSEAGLKPLIGFHSENGDLNLQMCLNGTGVLLAPENYLKHVLEELPESDAETEDPVLFYPIRVSSFQPELTICYDKGRKLHPAEICFIRTFQDMFHSS